MTSETVSAGTNKQNQENESDLKLLISNWMGSDVDIEILQSEDKAVKTIRDLVLTTSYMYYSYFRQRIRYSHETMVCT